MSRVWIPLAFLVSLLIFASAEENQNKFDDNGQEKGIDSALNGRENMASSLTEEASLERSVREPRKKKSRKGGKKTERRTEKEKSRKGGKKTERRRTEKNKGE